MESSTANERFVGTVVDFMPFEHDSKKKQLNAPMIRHCAKKGTAKVLVVKSKTMFGNADIFKRVSGSIPTLGPQIAFSFKCYKPRGPFSSDVYTQIGPVKLSRRHLRFDVTLFFPHVNSMHGLADSLTKAPRHPSINMMAYAYPRATRAALGLYDEQNGTNLSLQYNYFLYCIDQTVEADKTNGMQEMKALIVAQVLPFFKSMFGVEFHELMLLDLSDILQRFVKYQTEGFVDAFEYCLYVFDSDGFIAGSVMQRKHMEEKDVYNRAMAAINAKDGPNNNNSNNNADNEASDAMPEVIDVFDDDANPRKVVLQLTFTHAWNLYKQQKESGVIDMDDDDDPEEESETAKKKLQEAKKKMASLFGCAVEDVDDDDEEDKEESARLAKKGKAINIDIPIGRHSQVTMMSTDYRKTKVLPLDMNKLTAEEWLHLMLMDVMRREFEEDKHFYITGEMIMALVDDISKEADFPVKNVTVAMLEETLRSLIENRIVIAFSIDEGRVIDVKELATVYKDGSFVKQAPNMAYGLTRFLQIELDIAAMLNRFVVMNKQRHLDALQVRSNTVLRLNRFSQGGVPIVLSDEQKMAVTSAILKPLTIICGAGGTGKSKLMGLIYKILTDENPEAVCVAVAFKNDTVNQCRDSVRGMLGAELDDSKCYFVTADSFYNSSGIRDADRNPVAIDYLFIEEAGMISSRLMRDVLKTVKVDTVKKIIMFGDGEQLDPIEAGNPFRTFVAERDDNPMNAALSRLAINFRSDSAKLTKFLEKIRNKDLSNMAEVFDKISDIKTGAGCNFHISSVPEGYRSSDEVVLGFGRTVINILNLLDPQRTMYKKISAVCPYNDMSSFISWCFNFHYFLKGSLTQIGPRVKRMRLGTDSDDDDDDLPEAEDEFKELRPALARVRGTDKTPPIKYVGEAVYITKTDYANREIAQGRVCEITHIIDHASGLNIDISWFSKGNDAPLPHGFMSRPDTSYPLPQGKFSRTVILDYRTMITFPRGARLHTMIKESKCCTVHRAQGRQFLYNFCVFTAGARDMVNRRVFATAAGRAISQQFTFATRTVMEALQTVEPIDRRSILPSILNWDVDLVMDLEQYATLTRCFSERNVHVADLDLDGLDADEDHNSPNQIAAAADPFGLPSYAVMVSSPSREEMRAQELQEEQDILCGQIN